MNIADEIASILAENPDGLKASEIATRIGCTRKNVNSYLYAHKGMYEQHEGYIWTAKSVQKKMPHPACAQQPLPESSNSVSIQQTTGNTVVSTLTITPNGDSYCINSTNNQIICCDCKKFFSIHAQACPFCGCPTGYVAEYYYSKYDPAVIRQREIEEEKKRQVEQRRLKQEATRNEKERLIQTIAAYRHTSTYPTYELVHLKVLLEKLSISALKVAVERAETFEKLKAPFSISDDTYVDFLKKSNSSFQEMLIRAIHINMNKEVLPIIGDKEWNHIMALSFSDFDVRIAELMETHRLRQEAADREAKRRQEEETRRKDNEFKTMCGRYHIEGEQLQSMIKRYGSKEELLRCLQTIDDIGGEFRHKIDLVKFIDSPEALKELVKTLK